VTRARACVILHVTRVSLNKKSVTRHHHHYKDSSAACKRATHIGGERHWHITCREDDSPCVHERRMKNCAADDVMLLALYTFSLYPYKTRLTVRFIWQGREKDKNAQFTPKMYQKVVIFPQ
jgi:hypothetical protein